MMAGNNPEGSTHAQSSLKYVEAPKEALKIVTDDFLEWEERDQSVSLLWHCVAGK